MEGRGFISLDVRALSCAAACCRAAGRSRTPFPRGLARTPSRRVRCSWSSAVHHCLIKLAHCWVFYVTSISTRQRIITLFAICIKGVPHGLPYMLQMRANKHLGHVVFIALNAHMPHQCVLLVIVLSYSSSSRHCAPTSSSMDVLIEP